MKRSFTIIGFLLFSVISLGQPNLNWVTHGTGGGGALFAPSINPLDFNEYYVSCDMSQLFHTTDFGNSYHMESFNGIEGGHNSTMQFTNNPNIRYCLNTSGDLTRPVKSSDGGHTWNYLPGNPLPWDETYSIWVDFNNPMIVITSGWSQVFFSNNGGNSFSLIHSAMDLGAGIIVGGVFFDGNTIYLGTNDGILKSENSGNTFSNLGNPGFATNDRLFSFAAARQGNITRFFCLTGSVNDTYLGLMGWDYWGYITGVYAMDAGTTNWVQKMNGIDINVDYLMYVAMAENDINTVFLAGSNSLLNAPNIMKTSDGGNSWSHVFNTTNNLNISTGWCGSGGDRGWGYAESAFGISVARNNSSKLIFTDYGFVHKSMNGGIDWTQAYVSGSDQHPAGAPTPTGSSYHSSGLENTSCWQVFWADSLNMIGAYSDIKGIRSTDGGQTWSFNYSGLSANTTYHIVKQSSTGILFAATSNIHDIYESIRLQDNTLNSTDAQGKILFSTNNGATWQNLHYFGHPVYWLAIDPNNNNKMYASVIHSTIGGVYVSENIQNGSASTWTKLPNPPRTEGHPCNLAVLNDGTLVSTYSGRRNPSGTFTASSGIFTYNSTNNTWTDVSNSGMYYWTRDLTIDPSDPTQNTWFVGVFSGWGGPPNGLGGLYKTTNRGQSWTKISGLDRVHGIAFNPLNNNEIYLTTEEQGLWFSNNIHAGTPVFNMVSSYPFRHPERVFFNPYKPTELWCGSYGGGMMSAIMNTGFSISGSVKYENSALTPLTNVKVYLSNSVQALIDSTFTTSTGNFTFSQILPGNYSISATSSAAVGSINASDALSIQKHFVHLESLTSMKLQAADVDGGGYINSIDALMVQKYFVGLQTVFPAGNWKFSTQSITINTSNVNISLLGICVGDANASFIP
jgi:hypothetical protein